MNDLRDFPFSVLFFLLLGFDRKGGVIAFFPPGPQRLGKLLDDLDNLAPLGRRWPHLLSGLVVGQATRWLLTPPLLLLRVSGPEDGTLVCASEIPLPTTGSFNSTTRVRTAR